MNGISLITPGVDAILQAYQRAEGTRSMPTGPRRAEPSQASSASPARSLPLYDSSGHRAWSESSKLGRLVDVVDSL